MSKLNNEETMKSDSIPSPTVLNSPKLFFSEKFESVKEESTSNSSCLVFTMLEYFLYSFSKFSTVNITPKSRHHASNFPTRNQDYVYSQLLRLYLHYFLPTSKQCRIILEDVSTKRTRNESFSFSKPFDYLRHSPSPSNETIADKIGSSSKDGQIDMNKTILSVQFDDVLSKNDTTLLVAEFFIGMLSEWLFEEKKNAVIKSPHHLLSMKLLCRHVCTMIEEKNTQECSLSGTPQSSMNILIRDVALDIFRTRFCLFLMDAFPQLSMNDPDMQELTDLWINYSQPWVQKVASKPAVHVIEDGWGFFVAENFLFYTKVFRQWIIRTSYSPFISSRTRTSSNLFSPLPNNSSCQASTPCPTTNLMKLELVLDFFANTAGLLEFIVDMESMLSKPQSMHSSSITEQRRPNSPGRSMNSNFGSSSSIFSTHQSLSVYLPSLKHHILLVCGHIPYKPVFVITSTDSSSLLSVPQELLKQLLKTADQLKLLLSQDTTNTQTTTKGHKSFLNTLQSTLSEISESGSSPQRQMNMDLLRSTYQRVKRCIDFTTILWSPYSEGILEEIQIENRVGPLSPNRTISLGISNDQESNVFTSSEMLLQETLDALSESAAPLRQRAKKLNVSENVQQIKLRPTKRAEKVLRSDEIPILVDFLALFAGFLDRQYLKLKEKYPTLIPDIPSFQWLRYFASLPNILFSITSLLIVWWFMGFVCWISGISSTKLETKHQILRKDERIY